MGAVAAQKSAEAVLLGQFVSVLNAKKEEIRRLREDLSAANEKLEAERARLGRTPTASPATQPKKLDHAKSETDSGTSASEDNDDSDGAAATVPKQTCASRLTESRFKVTFSLCFAVDTLPLASFDQRYQPIAKQAHVPLRRTAGTAMCIVQFTACDDVLVCSPCCSTTPSSSFDACPGAVCVCGPHRRGDRGGQPTPNRRSLISAPNSST